MDVISGFSQIIAIGTERIARIHRDQLVEKKITINAGMLQENGRWHLCQVPAA